MQKQAKIGRISSVFGPVLLSLRQFSNIKGNGEERGCAKIDTASLII